MNEIKCFSAAPGVERMRGERGFKMLRVLDVAGFCADESIKKHNENVSKYRN